MANTAKEEGKSLAEWQGSESLQLFLYNEYGNSQDEAHFSFFLNSEH